MRRSTARSLLQGVAIAAYFLGICFAAPAYRDRGHLRFGSETPRELTLLDLAESGSPDNIHVVIRDVSLLRPPATVPSGSRTIFVIAALPTGDKKAKRPVLVRYHAVHFREVEEVYKADRIGGIINRDPMLTSLAWDQMQRHFPGQEIGSAVVIDVGEFPTPSRVYTHLMLATTLMGLGVALMWIGMLIPQPPNKWYTKQTQD